MDYSLTVVYQAVNSVDGKRYIGVTKRGLRDRVIRHKSSANTGSGYLLHRAMRKHGFDNFVFSVLADFEGDYELAKVYEYEAICRYRPEYNLTAGGEGGAPAVQTIEKMRAAKLGRKHSPEVRARRVGRKLSEEHRARIAAAQRGRAPTKGRTGQPVSEEIRAKIAATLRGRQWTDTPARQASRARTGTSAAQNARRVPVLCETDGLRYGSVKDAAAHYGFNATKLAAAIRADKAYKGLRFRRVRGKEDAGTSR